MTTPLTETTPIPVQTSVIPYRPQLDGLRFIAVFLVLFYHYSDWINRLQIAFTVDLGTFISFFFVLSSYLITTILLTNRRRDAHAGTTAWNFLVRRTLRIFPAYYFYLLLLMLLPVAGWEVRHHSAKYFLYLSNFLTYKEQYWNALTSHLWTLAVEEQFYLIWLFMILLIPDKYLPQTLWSMVVAGILFRILYFFMHRNVVTETVPFIILTPACIDAFAFGAVLAYQHSIGRVCAPILKKIFLGLLPVWILLIAIHSFPLLLGFGRVFAALGSMILIEGAGVGYQNRFGRFLEHKWVRYLGRISYGIYLYHLILPYVFWKCYLSFEQYLQGKGRSLAWLTEWLVNYFVSFLLYFLLTVLFATLSWYLLERPISRLKRYFNYFVSPAAPDGAAS